MLQKTSNSSLNNLFCLIRLFENIGDKHVQKCLNLIMLLKGSMNLDKKPEKILTKTCNDLSL